MYQAACIFGVMTWVIGAIIGHSTGVPHSFTAAAVYAVGGSITTWIFYLDSRSVWTMTTLWFRPFVFPLGWTALVVISFLLALRDGAGWNIAACTIILAAICSAYLPRMRRIYRDRRFRSNAGKVSAQLVDHALAEFGVCAVPTPQQAAEPEFVEWDDTGLADIVSYIDWADGQRAVLQLQALGVPNDGINRITSWLAEMTNTDIDEDDLLSQLIGQIRHAVGCDHTGDSYDGSFATEMLNSPLFGDLKQRVAIDGLRIGLMVGTSADLRAVLRCSGVDIDKMVHDPGEVAIGLVAVTKSGAYMRNAEVEGYLGGCQGAPVRLIEALRIIRQLGVLVVASADSIDALELLDAEGLITLMDSKSRLHRFDVAHGDFCLTALRAGRKPASETATVRAGLTWLAMAWASVSAASEH